MTLFAPIQPIIGAASLMLLAGTRRLALPAPGARRSLPDLIPGPAMPAPTATA